MTGKFFKILLFVLILSTIFTFQAFCSESEKVHSIAYQYEVETPPINPGLDPDFEAKRRASQPERYGLSFCLGFLIASIFITIILKKNKHAFASNVALSIASLALVLTILEVGFRVSFDDWAMHVKIRSNCYHDNPRGYFKESAMKDHPEIKAYCTDSLEHVWKRCDTKSPDTEIKFMTIGDSFTDGVGVFTKDTWPAQLERILHKHSQDKSLISVINCGHADFTTDKITSRYFNRNKLHNPNIVIYALVLNDVLPPMRSKRHADISFQIETRRSYKAYMTDGSAIGFLSKNSALFRFFHERMLARKIADNTIKMYQSTYEYPISENFKEALKQIKQINSDVKSHGGHFLVAIYPMIFDFKNYPLLSTHQNIQKELAKTDIQSLDLYKTFRNMDASILQVHKTDYHPNEIAQQKVAQAIYEEIHKLGYLR